jgi:hypothetical protein
MYCGMPMLQANIEIKQEKKLTKFFSFQNKIISRKRQKYKIKRIRENCHLN